MCQWANNTIRVKLLCISGQSRRTCRALLQCGADPLAGLTHDSQVTPLSLAIRYRRAGLIYELLRWVPDAANIDDVPVEVMNRIKHEQSGIIMQNACLPRTVANIVCHLLARYYIE